MIVKSIERNTANLYEARRRLLGLMNEVPVVTSSNHSDHVICHNRNFGGLSKYQNGVLSSSWLECDCLVFNLISSI